MQRLRQSGSLRSCPSNGQIRSDDIESSYSLPAGLHLRTRSSLGLIVSSDRPIPTLSTRSAMSSTSVYHDAVSRLETPVSVPYCAMTLATGDGIVPGSDAPPIGVPPANALNDPYDFMRSRAVIYTHKVWMCLIYLYQNLCYNS